METAECWIPIVAVQMKVILAVLEKGRHDDSLAEIAVTDGV